MPSASAEGSHHQGSGSLQTKVRSWAIPGAATSERHVSLRVGSRSSATKLVLTRPKAPAVWHICSAWHGAMTFHCMYVRTYVRTSVCMYVRTYVCMYVRTYVRTYVCTYVRTYVCMYVRTYIRMYVRTYVCMYVRTYVCMYVCMYVRT